MSIDGGRGEHTLGEGEQVPQVSGLLLLDMAYANTILPGLRLKSTQNCLYLLSRGLNICCSPTCQVRAEMVMTSCLIPRPWLKQFRKLQQSVLKSLILMKGD